MKSIQLLSLLILVAACSGGSRDYVRGTQCPAAYKPIDLNQKANQKVWDKMQNDASIPPGTYLYQRSDLIYTEKGENGAIIHVEDTADVKGVHKPHIFCVRNGKNLIERNLSVASSMASKIIASGVPNANVEAKELSFRIDEGRLKAESKTLPKPNSLKDAYTGKADDIFIIETLDNKVDYEVRSRFSDNTGEYILAVKFKRVP